MTTRKSIPILSATCSKADEVEHLNRFVETLPADSFLRMLLSDDLVAYVAHEIYNDHAPDAYRLICDLRRSQTEQLQANAQLEQALHISIDAHRREVEALKVDMQQARELHLSIEASLKAEHEATLLRVHAARDVDLEQVREEYDSLIETYEQQHVALIETYEAAKAERAQDHVVALDKLQQQLDVSERECEVVRSEYWRMACDVDNMRLQLEAAQAQVVALKCKLFDLQNPDLA